MSRELLRNKTLDFVGDVDTQSFIVSIHATLNRYYFGRLVRLKFHRESIYNQIVMTAEIKYPFKTDKIHPTTFTVQRTIPKEEIYHIIKQGKISTQSYIDHIVKDIIYNLALTQEAKTF